MIEERKREHVQVVLKEGAQARYNYWQDVSLVHCALPEINRESISLSTSFLGCRLSAPFIISAMTGGFLGSEKINANLAKAAASLGLAFGVGSQRAALLHPSLRKGYTIVAKYSPPLILANIGAPQLIPQAGARALEIREAEEIMKMVGAHALAVHLNFAQEVLQNEGDVNAVSCLKAIKRLAETLPVVAKETGCGISREAAQALADAGVKAIDIGGAGGTSFPAVESFRAKKAGKEKRRRMAETFWDWGIPTPASLLEAKGEVPIIATGGIRSGLDAAKAFALGADLVGIAYPVLKPASQSAKKVIEVLEIFIEELKTALFLTASPDLPALKTKRVVVSGPTAHWLAALGHKIGASK